MTLPARSTSETAAADAAAALAEMGQPNGSGAACSKPILAAQQAIRSPAALIQDNKDILTPSLQGRIKELSADLVSQRERTNAVMVRLTGQGKLVEEAAKAIQLLRAELDNKKEAFKALQTDFQQIESEHATASRECQETEVQLKRTQDLLKSLDQIDLEPMAAAGPSEKPKSSAKRTREEDDSQEAKKAVRVGEEPIKVGRVHDRRLLPEIFVADSQIMHYGKLSTILNFDPQTQQVKIAQLTGVKSREITVIPSALRYVPKVGEECLLKEEPKNDPAQHYFRAKIISVQQPTITKNPVVTIEWIDYPQAGCEERTIKHLDTLLPIDSSHPLLGQLRQEPVRQLDMVGTGYFLAKQSS